MSPEAHARLVELDGVVRASREFYEYAAAVLPASTLRERCQRLARMQGEIIALLAQRLPLQGRPAGPDPAARRSDLPQQIARVLDRARSGLATPDPSRLWDELQRMEAAKAEACRYGATGSRDADCRRELNWLLPLMQRCRDEFAPATAA